MKTYKITNLGISAPDGVGTQGYNCQEYFECEGDVRDLRFASREDAEEWLEGHYKGDDNYGVGVTWEIEAEDARA